ncbi:MAG: hypothetical protein R2751_01340 [Bacteroidales bacterium]
MRKSISLLLPLSVCIFPLVLASCGTLHRYASASYGGRDDQLADIQLYGYQVKEAVEGTSPRGLWDLNATAQSDLIKVLDRRFPGNTDFLEALRQTRESGSPDATEDYINKNLALVFSISRMQDHALLEETGSHFSPADRLSRLSFELRIPASYGLRFHSWDQFATRYGEYEIGDVGFSQTLGLGAESAGWETGEAGVKVDLSKEEKRKLRSRTLLLQGSLSELALRVDQEGSPEYDLAGNVTMEVRAGFRSIPEVLVVPKYKDTGGTGSAGRTLEDLSFRIVSVPMLEEVPDTLWARLTMDYVYRHVTTGERSFGEWDDGVVFYEGTVVRNVPLLVKGDVVPSFFALGRNEEPDQILRVKDTSGDVLPLHFSSWGEAGEFVRSMQEAWQADPTEPDCRCASGGYVFLFDGEEMDCTKVKDLNLDILPLYW